MEAEAAALKPLQISLQKPIFDADEPIELVIASETLITEIEGRLVFDRLTDEDRVEVRKAEVRDLRYFGPGIYSFAMTLDVALKPGFYELRFEGDRPITERVVFVVAE
jgi:hypothetical protein